ncbi:MAG TPA: hypothetical protein VLH16_05570 [Bacteroidales bacterium]|nr:hypothetical protein [Bacteroidales bacterium]
MAKTTFINGTTILSKFLNSIFGFGAKDSWAATTAYVGGDIIKLSGDEILRCIVAGTSSSSEPTAPGTLRGTVVDGTVTWELFGGHLHDDKLFDGSCPKVLLTGSAEVTGTLPLANQVEHVHSGEAGQFGKINLDDAAEVTGLLPLANLDHNFGVITEGKFNITWPDTVFTAEVVSECAWRKLVPHDTTLPNIITLIFKYFSGTSNSNALTLPGGTIPEALRPDSSSGNESAFCFISDNTTATFGIVSINSAGTLSFTRFDGSSFTSSGQKGVRTAVMIYGQWPA